jgi:hypothetical protein
MVGLPLHGESTVVAHVPNERQVMRSKGGIESLWTFVLEPRDGGTCLTDWNATKKPIVDFDIHPDNGTLYVLEQADSPNERKLQAYDVTGPTAVSQGILQDWTGKQDTIEFFPN